MDGFRFGIVSRFSGFKHSVIENISLPRRQNLIKLNFKNRCNNVIGKCSIKITPIKLKKKELNTSFTRLARLRDSDVMFELC